MATDFRQQAYITEVRTAAQKVWDGINELKALQAEWNALDYSTTLAPGDNQNTGITAAQIGSVVFDTANALEALLGQGHATNLANLL